MLNKKEMTIEDLAGMVQKGFLDMGEKIETLDGSIKELKITTDRIEADLNKKVDVFTHKDLEYRVEKLEEKLIGA